MADGDCVEARQYKTIENNLVDVDPHSAASERAEVLKSEESKEDAK